MAYVVIANLVIWLGIIGYMFFLAKENRGILIRLEQIEKELKQNDGYKK